jgi:hypothetical protein
MSSAACMEDSSSETITHSPPATKAWHGKTAGNKREERGV